MDIACKVFDDMPEPRAERRAANQTCCLHRIALALPLRCCNLAFHESLVSHLPKPPPFCLFTTTLNHRLVKLCLFLQEPDLHCL